ncbi:MAG TPA: 2-oxo acid dehydrogenase subunit E2, partial [Chthoniobacterales bacterium]|nr:2-oxo acid dehydrogenase subunit E2 [Chthoniobacterales bacterium]
RAVPLGKARKRMTGSDLTLIAWGNTVEKALEAIEQVENEASIELLDLRSISPWDRKAIEESVRKTRRIVVVQEDTENCSVGQMIIAHLASNADLWTSLVSPPILVSKGNVMIGYNPIYEYAALPDVERIVSAIRGSISTKTERVAAETKVVAAVVPTAESERKALGTSASTTEIHTATGAMKSITVPIMGEGIRSAKIVSLLKNPGDAIALDDALCEVETDKAVYPIESSFAGTMGEWKVEVGDTVEIGQELGAILTGEVAAQEPVAAVADRGRDLIPPKPRPTTAATTRDPALSPTITRKLSRVIPANLQIDARWDAIRKARDAAKKKDGRNAPSPSVMMAWAVVRAMEKHAPFRRLILEDDTIVENDDFDLGVAVAIEGDRLATAVITEANRKSWEEFAEVYRKIIDETRGGRVDAMNAPVVISSLGAFGVRTGAPIVVPPSVGTLFIGSAHREILPNGKQNETAEVITLSLTFDHRVVNGAGAANFAHEIKEQIEHFSLRSAKAVGIA